MSDETGTPDPTPLPFPQKTYTYPTKVSALNRARAYCSQGMLVIDGKADLPPDADKRDAAMVCLLAALGNLLDAIDDNAGKTVPVSPPPAEETPAQ